MQLPKLDLGYLPRMLRTRPGFTLVVVFTLALVLGPSTAIFSVVNSVLLQPLPYDDPDELVAVYSTTPQFGVVSVSYPDFEDWQRQNSDFSSMTAVLRRTLTLTGDGSAQRLEVRAVSADFFRTFGVDPVEGRFFGGDENQPGGPDTVVLGRGFWQRRFGGDEGLIGQTLTLDGESYTVIGVTPDGYPFSQVPDAFVALGPLEEGLQRRGERPGIAVYARLRDGVSLQQARTRLETVARGIAEQFPETNEGDSVHLVPLSEAVVGDARQSILLLWGAITFVVLIACANLTNLFLVRAAERRREFALRMAVGAGRWSVLRQQLAESGQLFLLGGGIALLLVIWTRGTLNTFIPPGVPRIQELNVGLDVIGFTLLFALVAGVLVGLLPALQGSRPGWAESLRQGSREVGGRSRVTGALVVCQIALTLLLLSSAGFTAASFWRLSHVDPGFETENILTLRTVLPEVKYQTAGQLLTFYDRAVEEVNALPQVERSAFTSALVMSHGNVNSFFLNDRPKPEELFSGLVYSVSDDYFQAMGIPLLRGRSFSAQDRPETPRVTVVDELLAERYWPDGDALGKQLCLDDDSEQGMCWEIIGIANHVKQGGLDEEALLQFYFPYYQFPEQFIPFIIRDMTMVVALQQPATPATVQAIKEAVWKLDPDQPVYNVRTIQEIVDSSIGQERFAVFLLLLCGGIAVVFAIVGIYAVIAYSVTQRTREIGVRMALGAQRPQILQFFLLRGLKLAGIGVVFGLLGGFAAARLVANRLYGVTVEEPMIFVLVATGLLMVTLCAIYLPARRATKVDPLVALRAE